MYIKSYTSNFFKFPHVPNSVHHQEKAKQHSCFYSRNSNFYCTDSAVTQSDASAFSLFVWFQRSKSVSLGHFSWTQCLSWKLFHVMFIKSTFVNMLQGFWGVLFHWTTSKFTDDLHLSEAQLTIINPNVFAFILTVNTPTPTRAVMDACSSTPILAARLICTLSSLWINLYLLCMAGALVLSTSSVSAVKCWRWTLCSVNRVKSLKYSYIVVAWMWKTSMCRWGWGSVFGALWFTCSL